MTVSCWYISDGVARDVERKESDLTVCSEWENVLSTLLPTILSYRVKILVDALKMRSTSVRIEAGECLDRHTVSQDSEERRISEACEKERRRLQQQKEESREEQRMGGASQDGCHYAI